MLSQNMIQLLIDCHRDYGETEQCFYKDGRTVRALQNRRLLKRVSFSSSPKGWHFHLTVKGRRLARGLHNTDTYVLSQITPW